MFYRGSYKTFPKIDRIPIYLFLPLKFFLFDDNQVLQEKTVKQILNCSLRVVKDVRVDW